MGGFLTRLITLRTVLVCVAFLPGNVGAQSQTEAVALNIRLMPVQTITIRTSQKTTDLVYGSVDDYENGVSIEQDDHLTVFSNSGFQITVAAAEPNFIQSGGNGIITVGDLTIRAGKGSNAGLHTRYEETVLSTTPIPIVESEKGGRDLKYNITYDNKIAGSSQKYIDRYVSSDGTETVYSANVTYTISTR